MSDILEIKLYNISARENTFVDSPTHKPSEQELQELINKGEHVEFLESTMVQGGEWYVQQWAKKYPEVHTFHEHFKQTQVIITNCLVFIVYCLNV